jgi:phosphotransferase system HPr (HPr) family protein
MTEAKVTIALPYGLHTRPAAQFYRTARAFQCSITVRNLSRQNSQELGLSLFNLLQIGASYGHVVLIRAEGADEQQAIQALIRLAEQNFTEGA